MTHDATQRLQTIPIVRADSCATTQGASIETMSKETRESVDNVRYPRDLTTESKNYGYARDWHKQFPPMLVVSITNVCNMRCVHCYSKTLMDQPDYVKSYLPFDIWQKLCDETANWPGVIINFGTDGEPILHPRMLDMLRYARGKNIGPINITCNGSKLTKRFVDAIIGENLVDVMNVSLDAVKSETYRKIRDYDQAIVLKHVHHMIDARNKARSSMKIQVNMIDQPEAHAEVDDFRKLWSPLVDNVMIRTYYDATAVTGSVGGNLTGKQSEFAKVERWPCQLFWRRGNIGDDGSIRFCTDDWHNQTKIGDLRVQSIHEVWTSEAYDKLRHLHMTAQFAKNSYCSKCTEWQGMAWNYDYFTAMEKMLGKKFV